MVREFEEERANILQNASKEAEQSKYVPNFCFCINFVILTFRAQNFALGVFRIRMYFTL